MQDSVLCPGSIPGSPITGVFVAVVRRSVTNNNNFNKVIVQLSKHWASMCHKEPQQCRPSLPGGLYLRKNKTKRLRGGDIAKEARRKD